MNQSVPWAQLMAVALGSAVGGVLRWAVQLWLNARWAGFPLGTLVVNCVGGLLIGIALAWFARTPNESMRLLLVTGFLGGLTTFSAFTGESLTLLQRGDFGWAVAHSFAHLAGALLCCAMGFRVAKTLLA
ncbi:MAG: fluoride efflux transporter CrcB [Rhizobacter sp.]|jgi:CrcB protein|nr:fluoride efflux transporter CrcB [Rhizobacter sp.]HOX67996.1 fluoride efflux transporter CrcB [Burkholderiaceae bacterium]